MNFSMARPKNTIASTGLVPRGIRASQIPSWSPSSCGSNDAATEPYFQSIGTVRNGASEDVQELDAPG